MTIRWAAASGCVGANLLKNRELRDKPAFLGMQAKELIC
jgi:hypothetical protein